MKTSSRTPQAPRHHRIGETGILSSKGLPADEAKKRTPSSSPCRCAEGRRVTLSKADPAREIDKVTWLTVILVIHLVLLRDHGVRPDRRHAGRNVPTRIRYTSMSCLYHIGNGWFDGLLPTTAFAIVAQTGNMYNGLWYPIIIAGATVVRWLFIKETKDVGHLRQRLILRELVCRPATPPALC